MHLRVGQEYGEQDEQPQQGVVHEGGLADGPEEGVGGVGEEPGGGGGVGVGGQVGGDHRAVPQEGPPGVVLRSGHGIGDHTRIGDHTGIGDHTSALEILILCFLVKVLCLSAVKLNLSHPDI